LSLVTLSLSLESAPAKYFLVSVYTPPTLSPATPVYSSSSTWTLSGCLNASFYVIRLTSSVKAYQLVRWCELPSQQLHYRSGGDWSYVDKL
jgi:hypothetical protein